MLCGRRNPVPGPASCAETFQSPASSRETACGLIDPIDDAAAPVGACALGLALQSIANPLFAGIPVPGGDPGEPPWYPEEERIWCAGAAGGWCSDSCCGWAHWTSTWGAAARMIDTWAASTPFRPCAPRQYSALWDIKWRPFQCLNLHVSNESM